MGDFLFAGGGKVGGSPDACKGQGSAHDGGPPWVIMVVDDDDEVHAVTRLAIARLKYAGRRVRLVHAYSAAEAEGLLREATDVALILLDVVMETEDAGLRLVRLVRHDMGNLAVRIILRTGQPGQAPEERVILDYDINDYKEKTELTSQKLFTAVVSALRSYADITALNMTRAGLCKVIEASATLFRKRSLHLFAEGILTQITGLLDIGAGGVLCVQESQPGSSERDEEGLFVLAASGHFAGSVNRPLRATAPADVIDTIMATVSEGGSRFEPHRFSLCLKTPNGRCVAVLCDSDRPLGAIDRQLIEAFAKNISVGFDNLFVIDQMRRANRATMAAVAEVAERRNGDGARHVLKVSRLSVEIGAELARIGKLGDVADGMLEGLCWAATIHDIGKLMVPTEIIAKPGPLTAEERALIESHCQAGSTIIQQAVRLAPGNEQLALAASIARHHHEHFDGKGYPDGLAGSAIPLGARIVAVADVFESLTSRLTYRCAWPVDEAIEYIRTHAGSQFDPDVVDAFLTIAAPEGNMVLIEWMPEMSVGVAELDEDHKNLLGVINELAQADSRYDRCVIEGVLDELVAFMGAHFAREEAFMERCGYADLARHCQLHAALAAEVFDIRREFVEGFTLAIGDRVLRFLVNWWRGHLLDEDSLFRPIAAAPRDER